MLTPTGSRPWPELSKIANAKISLEISLFPSSEIRLLMTITKRLIWTSEFSIIIFKLLHFIPAWRIKETFLPSLSLPQINTSRSIVEYRPMLDRDESRSIFEGGGILWKKGGDRLIFSRGGRKSRTNDASPARSPARSFPQPRDIIGSNASRQTIREISYRLVAALAPLVTAYSWNALASL